MFAPDLQYNRDPGRKNSLSMPRIVRPPIGLLVALLLLPGHASARTPTIYLTYNCCSSLPVESGIKKALAARNWQMRLLRKQRWRPSRIWKAFSTTQRAEWSVFQLLSVVCNPSAVCSSLSSDKIHDFHHVYA